MYSDWHDSWRWLSYHKLHRKASILRLIITPASCNQQHIFIGKCVDEEYEEYATIICIPRGITCISFSWEWWRHQINRQADVWMMNMLPPCVQRGGCGFVLYMTTRQAGSCRGLSYHHVQWQSDVLTMITISPLIQTDCCGRHKQYGEQYGKSSHRFCTRPILSVSCKTIGLRRAAEPYRKRLRSDDTTSFAPELVISLALYRATTPATNRWEPNSRCSAIAF